MTAHPSFFVFMEDAVPKNADVLCKHGEVVAFFEQAESFVLPADFIFRQEAVFLHSPVAAFCAGLGEEKGAPG